MKEKSEATKVLNIDAWRTDQQTKCWDKICVIDGGKIYKSVEIPGNRRIWDFPHREYSPQEDGRP